MFNTASVTIKNLVKSTKEIIFKTLLVTHQKTGHEQRRKATSTTYVHINK
jgi:hypothetical protein